MHEPHAVVAEAEVAEAEETTRPERRTSWAASEASDAATEPAPDGSRRHRASNVSAVEASECAERRQSRMSNGSRLSGGSRGSRRRPSLRSSTSSIAHGASILAGFQPQDPENPETRESLMEQGIEGQEADLVLVRLHEEEVLMQNFHRYIQLFSLLVCLLTPAMLGIMTWMLFEYLRYRETYCREPLQMWCVVVASTVAFNATLNRPQRGGSWVVRFCCMYTPDPTVPQPTPLRVRLYNAGVALFIFTWNLYGLLMVLMSGAASEEDKPCSIEAPGLYSSVKVYVALNLAFTVFFYVNMVGFNRFLSVMMRRGMLTSSMAAPKGTLEESTRPVLDDDKALTEQTTCSICLDDLEAGKDALKTRVCGHIFHKQCLQGWLNVNRNCPICRFDLVSGKPPATAKKEEMDEPQAQAAQVSIPGGPGIDH